MNLKKTLTTLACGLFLALGASSAHAALLENWTYELSSTSLTNFNTNFVTVGTAANGKQNMTFTSGFYTTTIDPNGTFNGSFGFSEDKTSASTPQNTYLVNTSSVATGNDVANATPATKLADLMFTYRVASVDEPGVWMEIDYTIPLYTYYDAKTETAYVYYNNSEVAGAGATAITHDGYKYGATGIGLFVDGRALESLDGAEGDPNLYSGWAINGDTMTNNYEEYVVGSENNVSTGLKDPSGVFNITGIFSAVATPVGTDPTPTPEPATLILSGLGLAGISALKRRRNK